MNDQEREQEITDLLTGGIKAVLEAATPEQLKDAKVLISVNVVVLGPGSTVMLPLKDAKL